MVQTVGIDMVRIDRMRSWGRFSFAALSRYFTPRECLLFSQVERGSIEQARLIASHFGAKEAFYKAYSQQLIAAGLPLVSFISVAPRVELIKDRAIVPTLVYDNISYRERSGCEGPQCHSSVSLSHEGEYVAVIVLLVSIEHSSPLCDRCEASAQ